MTIKNPTLEDIKKLQSQGHYWIRLEGVEEFTVGQLHVELCEKG